MPAKIKQSTPPARSTPEKILATAWYPFIWSATHRRPALSDRSIGDTCWLWVAQHLSSKWWAPRQLPDHRECVEEGKGKWPVGLGRIVGERADDAVTRLHDRHGDSQNCKCHAGTNTDCDDDRHQQGDA